MMPAADDRTRAAGGDTGDLGLLFHRLNNQLGIILANAELLEAKSADEMAPRPRRPGRRQRPRRDDHRPRNPPALPLTGVRPRTSDSVRGSDPGSAVFPTVKSIGKQAVCSSYTLTIMHDAFHSAAHHGTKLTASAPVG